MSASKAAGLLFTVVLVAVSAFACTPARESTSLAPTAVPEPVDPLAMEILPEFDPGYLPESAADGDPLTVAPTAPGKKSKLAPFADEPKAHALYDGMIDALQSIKSLSYDGEKTMTTDKREWSSTRKYRMWLKAPNFTRLEALNDGKVSAVLVGDGMTHWIYWPMGRYQHDYEREGKAEHEFKKTRFTSYIRTSAPPGMHSISHEAGDLGLGMFIVNPSVLSGYTGSLERFLDGVRHLGSERIDGVECELIEVSIMYGQRRWFLWLTKDRLLPIKQKELIYVRNTIIVTDHWSNVVVDGEISDDRFQWAPPENWVRFVKPSYQEKMLRRGSKAPDFDLASINGGRISLSDYRGRVVWLYIWRAG